MIKKKKSKSKLRKTVYKNSSSGLSKIASITTKSLSSAYANFKKKTGTK